MRNSKLISSQYWEVFAQDKLDLPVDVSRTSYAKQKRLSKNTVKNRLNNSGKLYSYLYDTLRDSISVSSASDSLPAELLPLLDACMASYERSNRRICTDLQSYTSFDIRENTDAIFWYLVNALLKKDASAPLSFSDVYLLKGNLALVSGTDHLCGDLFQQRLNMISEFVLLSPPAAYPRVMKTTLQYLDEAIIEILHQIDANGGYRFFGDHADIPSDNPDGWKPLDYDALSKQRQEVFHSLTPLDTFCENLLQFRGNARKAALRLEQKKDSHFLADFAFPASEHSQKLQCSFDSYLAAEKGSSCGNIAENPSLEDLRAQYDTYLLSLTPSADRNAANKSLHDLHALKEYIDSSASEQKDYRKALICSVWDMLSPRFSDQTGMLEPSSPPSPDDQIQVCQTKQICTYLLTVFERQFQAIDRFQTAQMICKGSPMLCGSPPVTDIALYLLSVCAQLSDICLQGFPSVSNLKRNFDSGCPEPVSACQFALDAEEYAQRRSAVIQHLGLQTEQLGDCDASGDIAPYLQSISCYAWELFYPAKEKDTRYFPGFLSIGLLLQSLLLLACLEQLAAQVDLACLYREDLQSARDWLASRRS